MTNILENEWLFAEYFFFIVPVIDNLNRYFIGRLHDVEGEHFSPLGTHAIRLLDNLSVFDFFYRLADIHVVDLIARLSDNLDHGFKLVDIEELLVELTIDDCERQRAAFHDRHSIDEVASFPLFQCF